MKDDRYKWYKEHGICWRCKKEKAAPNRTLCEMCGADQAEKSMQKRENMSDEQKEKYYAKNAKSTKKLRKQRRQNGLCADCGRKSGDKYYCVECRIKRYRWTRRECIPRSERSSFGMCYTCGKPVVPGKKLCAKHLKSCQERAEKMRTAYQNADHVWRQKDD